MSVAYQIFTQPSQQALDTAASVLSGATLTFSLTGTSTATNAYSDSTRLTPVANPLAANSAGVWIPVFLDPAIVYRIVLKTAAGVVLQTWDPANENWISALTQQFLGQIIYPRTQGEIDALPVAVTPTFYIQPPQVAIRYEANTTPGVTDMQSGIQQAIDSAYGLSTQVQISARNALASPLLFRTTTTENASLIGNGRVSTILQPLAADISTLAQGINTLIFNQNNNGNIHLAHLRCLDSSAYTGVFFYSKEGGGTDLSGQAAFSMVIDDCWFSFSSNNAGYFQGGFNNLQVVNSVFESTKTGCFILEGIGTADLLFTNVTQNLCFDSFIYANLDSIYKDIISVNGLHAYQHLRGPLFELNNCGNVVLQDIVLEPSSGNLGTTGLFKFIGCSNVICADFFATTIAGNPKCATGIEINGAFSGKFSNGKIEATTGLKFSGTGSVDITLEDVDFTGCDNAIEFASGATAGYIRTRNCRFNNAQKYCLLSTVGGSWNWYSEGDEFLNAGMNGTATNRNINISTSGEVRIIRCRLGQNNGGAAAAKYINAIGAGTLTIIDPQIVGTPPTAFSEGAQAITLDGVDSTMPGMTAFTPIVGGTATYTTQLGRWSLKGGIVSFYGDLQINAIGTGSQVSVLGLPFTSSATYYGGGFVHFFAASATAVTEIGISVAPGTTTCLLRSLAAAGAATANNNILQNATRIIFSGSYPL